ncbi:MAG: hypothetical protein MUC49_06035 [Raineya sp.]|jgi:hypothetical protein|nr:hypothetical protein [Raineya sp.]
MTSKTQILLFLIIFLNFQSILGQDKTTFYSNNDNFLNISLHKKVKNVSVKNENFINNYSEIFIYEFTENNLPLKIIYSGIDVNILEKRLREGEIHYLFKEGRLVSKLNKLVNGLDGEIYEYDKNWNLVLEKHYISNTLIQEISSKYDSRNKIIEKIKYLYGTSSNYDQKTQTRKEKYLYDRKNYEYDDKNNCIKEITENFRKKFIEEKRIKFDSSNNLVEEGHCFISNKKKDCQYKPLFGFEYDVKNRLIKKFQLTQFSPHNTDQYFKYDEKDNKIESTGYYIYPNKEAKMGYQFKYEYDEYGNLIKDIALVGGHKSVLFDRYTTDVFKYDKFQNIVAKECLTESNIPVEVTTMTYIYDNHGNWIKRETKKGKNYDNLQVIEISTREIEYYK